MSNTSSNRTAVGRGAFWSMLNQFIGQGLVLAIFLVTARFVPQEDFGVMAVCYLVVEFFRQILVESIGNTLIARPEAGERDYNAGFVIIMAGCAAAAALVFLTAPVFASFFGNEELEYGLRITSVLLLTLGLSKIHETRLIKKMDFKALALRTIFSTLIGGAAGIAMAINGYGLESLLTQQITTSLFGTIWLWIAAAWRPRLYVDKEAIYSMLNFSRFLSLSAITAFVSSQIDIFFSSYYLGAAATGVYNASKRIVTAMNLIFVAGLNSVAFPAIAAKKADESYKHSFARGMMFVAAVTAPAYMGAAVLSKDIVLVLLGPKWAETAPLISILAMSGFLSSIDQFNNNTRMIFGKPDWQFYINSASAAANVAVLFIFARYGLQPLAIAFVMKTALLYPLSLITALRLIDLKPVKFLAALAPVCGAALIMGGGVFFLQSSYGTSSPAVNLLICVPAGFVLYAVSLFLLNKELVLEVTKLLEDLVKGLNRRPRS